VMSSKLFVLDTNVIVSAVLSPRSIPRQAFDLAYKFLELAVSGDAKCIVSGDADLLVLDPFRGIPIVTPQVFVNQM
jgi:predicted nucleic acid-binding protein